MGEAIDRGIPDQDLLHHFLVCRQTTLMNNDEEPDEEPDEELHDNDIKQPDSVGLCAGFNGRCNKYADTCYVWWACATLKVNFVFLSYSSEF